MGSQVRHSPAPGDSPATRSEGASQSKLGRSAGSRHRSSSTDLLTCKLGANLPGWEGGRPCGLARLPTVGRKSLVGQSRRGLAARKVLQTPLTHAFPEPIGFCCSALCICEVLVGQGPPSDCMLKGLDSSQLRRPWGSPETASGGIVDVFCSNALELTGPGQAGVKRKGRPQASSHVLAARCLEGAGPEERSERLGGGGGGSRESRAPQAMKRERHEE